MKTARTAALTLVVALAIFAAAAAPVWSAPRLSWNDKQVAPGLTRRSIWSEAQIATYALPTPVTHTGYIHLELTYRPPNGQLVFVLLDRDGHVCDTTAGQGQLGTVPGKETIDYYVRAVLDQTPTPEGVDPVRGDVYYVQVQALNGTSSFRLGGYYPRLRHTGHEPDTASPQTLVRGPLAVPSKLTSWVKLRGAPYGGPFDLRPTSQGHVEARLEYPTAAAARESSPLPAPTAMPAAFDQYVAVADYTAWPVADTDPAGLTHWDLGALNRHDSGAPAWNGAWYGLDDVFTVQWGDVCTPVSPTNPAYHFAPTLRAVASSAALGPASPPATGRRTVGYKATLLFPQHLYLRGGAVTVRRGARLTLKGLLALPATPGPDAVLAWAPAGTPVLVERKTGSVWRPVRVVTTRANGAWSAVVRASRNASWRARWLGAWQARLAITADGDLAAPQWSRSGAQTTAAGQAFSVSVTASGVTFALASGTFADGTTSLSLPDGGKTTRVLQGKNVTFRVVKGTVRRGDEISVARRIRVR